MELLFNLNQGVYFSDKPNRALTTMNIISTVILSIVSIVILTILMLTVTWIMFYIIDFSSGFIEAFIETFEDFINTRKNK